MKLKSSFSDKQIPAIEVHTGLKAGYRPVHGLVAPDGWKYWTPGWFDLDSQGRYATMNSAPPPPPEE